jgi:hypothetical protein
MQHNFKNQTRERNISGATILCIYAHKKTVTLWLVIPVLRRYDDGLNAVWIIIIQNFTNFCYSIVTNTNVKKTCAVQTGLYALWHTSMHWNEKVSTT